MTPRKFCRQSLQVLRLPAGTTRRPSQSLETVLGYFAAEDLDPGTFELQLHLLADPDLCPCFEGAATRLLEQWRREQHCNHDLARRASYN